MAITDIFDWQAIGPALLSDDKMVPEDWKYQMIGHGAMIEAVRAGYTFKDMASEAPRKANEAQAQLSVKKRDDSTNQGPDIETNTKHGFFVHVAHVAETLAARVAEIEFMEDCGYEPSNTYEGNGYSQAAIYEPVDLTAGFENVASMMGNLSFLDLA